MGSVLGKTGISVENGLSPKYNILFSGSGYEVRNYVKYIVAEVARTDAAFSGKGTSDSFYALAKYIGVFGKPNNRIRAGGDEPSGEVIPMTAPVVMADKEESEAISMTAPVVMISGDKSEAIPMTAPVVMEPAASSGSEEVSMTAPVAMDSGAGGSGTMQFIMPSKYQSISELPEPIDPRVTLREVPEQVVLARIYYGNLTPERSEKEKEVLVKGVKEDGIFSEFVVKDFKVITAGYNPPFTLPPFKKNEVWVPLPLSKEAAEEKLAATSS
ncbi:unnamed protein product [Discosporangium mesarthrocarpum]